MATALSLSPLFRQSVGFDRFNDLFETLAAETPNKTSFPPYDIVKNGEDNYEISMAVAGFAQNEIAITLENDTLSVKGQHTEQSSKEETENDKQYLYRGIAKRNFERSFRLADNMKVKNASMENGLLKVSLQREIPEEKKPQLIAINGEK